MREGSDLTGSGRATSAAFATTAFEVSGTIGCGALAMIAGVGWDGPAEASFIAPALTCTVLTLTGFIGSDEPGTVPIGWVWITPAVSGAGSIFGSAFCSTWAGPAAPRRWPRRARPSPSRPAACAWRAASSCPAIPRLPAARPALAGRLRRGFGDLDRSIGAIALGDRGDRAGGRGLGKVFGEQAAHDGIARAAAAAAHDDADQEAVAAMHRGHEVEAGSAGVAGLDAVDAVDAAEQVIVVGDGLAAEA